nr:hypothetical protein [bacterium]
MVKIVCWNIAHRHAAWQFLLNCDADIALLQEAGPPPADVARQIKVGPAPFLDADGKSLSRAAVVKLSDRVQVEWLKPVPIHEARGGDFVESQPGSIAAAIISAPQGGPEFEPFIAVSICAEYARVHRCIGKNDRILDAPLHRVISDLSLLIGHVTRHRIVVAGDLTIWHGYGSPSWKRRHDTVFDRMEALGLPLVGPKHPHGRQAEPWPTWLPKDSLNVPTHYNIGGSPATATHQLDYVFASRSMAESVEVRALNGVDEWGPSDHCRIEITVT